ncbi:MAG: YdcF family protein [Anaerolineaceae bacterium]|nr:YdcF family protein [Anaerolineaceae bacterium]
MNLQTDNPPIKNRNSSRKIIITLLLSIFVCCLCSPIIMLFLGRFLLVNDRLQPADVVVALGGDATLDRLEMAVELYHDGLADALIITETTATVYTGQQESLYLRNQAMAMGVPENAIFVTEVNATSTWDEARAVRKLMLQNNWTSCIAVTDPYHTRRVKIAFTQDFKAHGLNVSVIYTPDHWYRPSTWFLTGKGRQTTLLEYVKILGQLFGFENYELK